ncbi:tRNA pseudouridine(55) synthase TruB [Campylobacter sp. JMF_01 NE2]|uniref:tRNA pseudouridine(55) synthase TruB n=1 Tax=unclassified Campylobacter TaxID=2593542 RepID=UPI0022E9B236|nr:MULTISPECIES: tRNA pseudouridine(55) synthase TruB [unclassified Campylobacter]MDA3052609.1 tRNA pseudouridine(55) synthase TruB [Campylobacter sp. JMF_03 NE3]MDA3066940.1 tRNA pseudouridine(55) synthase TruB [Campylobacter sp. JMF_01 NE2]
MNRLFLANKPAGISSNQFLGRLKRKYGVKKAGFSGTLDPFASGALVIGFGEYTRFFRFLRKTPKIYIATLWFGASSESGDNENIYSVENVPKLSMEQILGARDSLLGLVRYTPPKFSAKKIDGVRAYELARRGEEVALKEQVMSVYECEILSYRHPFLSFKISVSEGGYIRSYGQLLCKKLGVCGTLSALCRVSEGEFSLENPKFMSEASINPKDYLNLKENFYNGDKNEILLGKKLRTQNFKFQNSGEYLINLGEFHAIIEICDGEVKYLWNRIKI